MNEDTKHNTELPLDSSELETVEEARLESREVPRLDADGLPHGVGAKFLLKLTGARAGSQVVIRGAMIFVAITFVPLLVISAFQGTALPGVVKVPLLADYISMSRFLIVAPILILSDLLTRPWIIKVAEHLLGTFIEEQDQERYIQTFNQIFRIRSSLLLDLLLFLVAFISSIFNASVVLALDVSSWHLVQDSGPPVLTAAGNWNAFVSQPLFRFVIIGWTFDYFCWVYFLFKASRFKLKVLATHPDKAGGLAFISVAQTQFCAAAFAISVAVSCVVAHSVLYAHANLKSFTNLGLVFLAVMIVIFVGPLLFFSPTLLKSKQKAIFSYGSLCHEMSKLFANKWLIARQPDEQPIISSQDPSSLADLNASYQTIADMKPFVFGHQFVVVFVLSSVLPALPLVATVIPLKDLVVQILKMLS